MTGESFPVAMQGRVLSLKRTPTRFRRKRVLDRIQMLVSELNEAMRQANNAGLIIDAILDRKVLPFPFLSIRILQEIKYDGENNGQTKT